MLQAFSQTDAIYGGNCRTAIFRLKTPVGYNQWKRVFNFTAYVRPKKCGTLLSKLVSNGALLDNMLEYACLRYFLWFLVTGKWCKDILLQRNTDMFFQVLFESAYACWVVYFDNPNIKGYDKYFL